MQTELTPTNLKDDNNIAIYVGDTLKSEWGYDLIVSVDSDGDFYGKLVCDDNHSCKDIPYSLNEGKGHIKIINNEENQNPTIAEMKEVVAKYMGWIKYPAFEGIQWRNEFREFICYGNVESFLDWNRLHEVWEKVREEKIFDYKKGVPYGRIKSNVMISIIKGIPLETLTALYNCIQFINQLKESNDNNGTSHS